ncbi:MAG: hypothetical protein EBR51_06755 [Gammaproteobacteria bacterium]|nr:hypothetical protein [Gammaproteobacteria bacterium]
MAVYTVRAPDGATIELTGPDGASQEEVIAQAQRLYAQRQAASIAQPGGEEQPMELEISGAQRVSPEEYARAYPGANVPETTAAGLAGAVTRGVAPAAVMAGLGALAAPVVGVPALAGAGLGAAALGASQLLGLDTGFTQQLQSLLSRAGVAEPQTATERLLQAAAGGLSSGVGCNLRRWRFGEHVREIGQAVKSIPGSSARAAEMEGLAQVGETALKLLEDVGGTRDLSTLNERVRSGIKQQAEVLKNTSDALYQEIAQAIPSNTRVRADKTLAYIQQRAKEMNGVENLTPIEKELLSKLTPKQIPSKSGKSVREIPPTYALVDELRKDVGEIAGGPGLVPDRSTRVAKELRELMTQDQEVAAQAAGVADKWAKAKDAVKLRKGLEDDMGLLFGKAFDESLVTRLTTSATGLSKGDADRFAKIVKAIPDNMRSEVVASALGTAFGRATKNGELNFNTFANFMDGLDRNKQAKAALFSNLTPAARAQFEDVATVSRSIAKATRENIPNGRVMSTQQQLKEADSFADTLYGLGARVAAGAAAEVATIPFGLRGAGLAAGLVSGLSSAMSKQRTTAAKAADAVLLSPEFRRLVVENAGNPTVQQTAIRRLASSPKFDAFAQAAGLPRAMSDRELFIRNALTAGATAEPQEQPTP